MTKLKQMKRTYKYWLKSEASRMTIHRMLEPIDERLRRKIINLAIFYGYGA